jgi:hypothetical protein
MDAMAFLKFAVDNIRPHAGIGGDHMVTVHKAIDAAVRAAEDAGLVRGSTQDGCRLITVLRPAAVPGTAPVAGPGPLPRLIYQSDDGDSDEAFRVVIDRKGRLVFETRDEDGEDAMGQAAWTEDEGLDDAMLERITAVLVSVGLLRRDWVRA